MTFPPQSATPDQWQSWLQWARENPTLIPAELRVRLNVFDEMAIEFAKLWRTVNRQ
jgi:hypothetical protein